MEMGPGHLASSGNLLCTLSRTADFEHEVADANQQTLISFPLMQLLFINFTFCMSFVLKLDTSIY